MKAAHSNGQSLGDRAFARLKRRVLNGDLEPGAVLSERKLAERLGMSKTPVRTAIQQLSNEGFLTIAPQQGIVVTPPDFQDLADAFELRSIVEPYVLIKLAERSSKLDFKRLLECLEAQKNALESGKIAKAAELDLQFHMELSDMFGNSQIKIQMRRLKDHIHRAIMLVREQEPQRALRGYDEHEQITAYLRNGDGEKAAALMRVHLKRGLKYLLPS